MGFFDTLLHYNEENIKYSAHSILDSFYRINISLAESRGKITSHNKQFIQDKIKSIQFNLELLLKSYDKLDARKRMIIELPWQDGARYCIEVWNMLVANEINNIRRLF